MSRFSSWIMTGLFIAAGYFGYTKGLPAFEHWKMQRIAEEVCKDTGVRVDRGLALLSAQAEVREELISRMDQRANLRLDDSMFEVIIWAGKCTVKIKLKDGTRIHAEETFPEE